MREPEKICDKPNNDSRIPVYYTIVKNESLGGGGFGEVFKVQREIPGEQGDNQFYAMKRIKKEGLVNEKDKHYRILSEIKIHRTLKNKYICKYEHSFEDDQNIYIIMEFCERKSIDDYLKIRKSFTEYETRYYMYQVLEGLKYLRRKKVVHRDLTLANIFLKDYKSIKIGDFGLSFIETENEEKPGLICGTQGYFTPESIQTKYSFKTDIFCLGVCIYHMMTGTTLFKDAVSSYDAIKKGDINYDEKTRFSKECKDLFEQIFVFENKRIDLDEISVHPFFNEGRGLVGVDFPNYFDEKTSRKDFEEKIRILEKNVIMTEVSTMSKKKDDNYFSKKTGEFSGENWDNNNSNEKNFSKDNFLKDSIKNMLMNKKVVSFKKNDNDNNKNNNDLKEKIINKNKEINDINKNKNENEYILNTPKIERKNDKENDLLFNEKPFSILDQLTQQRSEKLKEKDKDKDKEKIEQKLILTDVISENNEENEKDSNKDNNKNEKLNDNNNINQNLNNECFDIDTLNPKESNKFIKKIQNDEEEESKINIEQMNFLQNIYIKKIIKDNDKIGIGYLLNNDDIGILFNDDTIIIKFNQYKNLIYYINSKNKLYKILLPLKSNVDFDLVNKIHFLDYIIEELKKKKSRMKSINNNYEENSKMDDSPHFNKIIKQSELNNIKNKNYVYVLKYKKNNYAQFFILSNNLIQIKYRDDTDIIFVCSDNKKIIYINNNGNSYNFDLEPNQEFFDFNCNDPKINKKIKYAIKEIIK